MWSSSMAEGAGLMISDLCRMEGGSWSFEGPSCSINAPKVWDAIMGEAVRDSQGRRGERTMGVHGLPFKDEGKVFEWDRPMSLLNNWETD